LPSPLRTTRGTSTPQRRLNECGRQHAAILEAIEAGDGDRAESLIVAHISETTEIAVNHFGVTPAPKSVRENETGMLLGNL